MPVLRLPLASELQGAVVRRGGLRRTEGLVGGDGVESAAAELGLALGTSAAADESDSSAAAERSARNSGVHGAKNDVSSCQAWMRRAISLLSRASHEIHTARFPP